MGSQEPRETVEVGKCDSFVVVCGACAFLPACAPEPAGAAAHGTHRRPRASEIASSTWRSSVNTTVSSNYSHYRCTCATTSRRDTGRSAGRWRWSAPDADASCAHEML